MPGTCATCRHPQVREINHRLREERPLTDISRWLDDLGTPITRQALARHLRDHLGEAPAPQKGRRPLSKNFLEAVVQTAQDRLENGELAVTVRDGISAQAEINRQQDRSADRDLMLKIGLALTGGGNFPRIVSPEVDEIEGEFREQLMVTAGDDYPTIGG